MSAGRPASRTAWRVAVRRATHQLLDRPRVLDDPIALPILGDEMAAALRNDPAAEDRGPFDKFLRAFMVARARFAEDHVQAARERGVAQYVILGAGLDTFAYRQRPGDPPVRLWEVDHPVTQAWKRERLLDARIPVPSNVRYVPVDFERDALPSALERAGFDRGAGAAFSWLGVTMYLTESAIDATLAFIASVCGPAGGVAFDYAMDPELLTPAQRAVVDALAARVAAAGEPWRTTFSPEGLAVGLARLGFGQIEDAGGDELNARYFAGRSDGLRVGGAARIVWATCATHSVAQQRLLR